MKSSTLYSGAGVVSSFTGTALMASGFYTLGVISYCVTAAGVILGIRACENELSEGSKGEVTQDNLEGKING